MNLYPSPLWKRVVAFAIDILFIFICNIFLVAVLAAILSKLNPPDWFLGIVIFIYVCICLFTIPIMETFMHGKTVGKRLCGIKIVHTDGRPVSGVSCIQRYLILWLELGLTGLVGPLACAMLTKRRQRLGDLAADTMVVIEKPHQQAWDAMQDVYNTDLTPEEKAIYAHANSHEIAMTRLELAQIYRQTQCDIARLRTHKSHPHFIEYFERQLSAIHLELFHKKIYTFRDMVSFALRSIPRAVYESRWCVLASLAIALVSMLIGVYSQTVDPEFFRHFFGDRYTDITLQNISEGRPMGIYSGESEWMMFFGIFFNNLFVTLKLYIMGIFVLIGPIVFLVCNFVMDGCFNTFFAQQGLLGTVLVTPNEHGTLELWSIIMAGAAALRLGSGWLFPGRLTRLHAFARSARQSVLILISTIPALLVAAFIESFITRHTEWPLGVKLGIIIGSVILIIGYYVVLPILSKRRQPAA